MSQRIPGEQTTRQTIRMNTPRREHATAPVLAAAAL